MEENFIVPLLLSEITTENCTIYPIALIATATNLQGVASFETVLDAYI